jgi:hypothetical protein
MDATAFFPQILDGTDPAATGGGNWSGDAKLLRNGGVPQVRQQPRNQASAGISRAVSARMTHATNYSLQFGGTQAANLTLQLEHIKQHIGLWLPDPAFSGHSGIDFENWSPIWADNSCPCSFMGRRYQNLSIELVRHIFG